MGAPEIGSSTAEEMEEKSSRRMYISVILNLVNFLLVVWSVGSMLVWRGTGNMQVSGSRAFMYFTVDSNVLCAIASLLIAGCQIRREVPPGIFIFKYVGTTAVTVTLMTVLLFLGPVLGYGGMFSGINLFLHLICPLLAIGTLVFTDSTEKIRRGHVWLSILPTFLYGIVYLYKVVYIGAENGGWHDFYGFNINGLWYVSLVVMLLATGLLGWILRLLHNKSMKE